MLQQTQRIESAKYPDNDHASEYEREKKKSKEYSNYGGGISCADREVG